MNKLDQVRSEKALRRAREDDLSTWSTEDNDVSLWPSGWKREKPQSEGGDPNKWFIPVHLREHYKRSAERDAKVLREWPRDREEMAREVPNHSACLTGRGWVLSGREPEFVCHWAATVEAYRRYLVAELARRERALDAEHTCEICGVVDRADVKSRDVGGWRTANLMHRAGTLGPRLCSACEIVAGIDVERRCREAVETMDDGRSRIEAVKVWIDANVGRIMGT